jgi:hypothetical protein
VACVVVVAGVTFRLARPRVAPLAGTVEVVAISGVIAVTVSDGLESIIEGAIEAVDDVIAINGAV